MSWHASLVTICLAVAATCISARGALARPAVAASRAVPAPAVTSAAQRLAAEQAAYDHAADPVAKAKALAKLEPGVFAQARKTLEDGDDVGSLAQLQQFRDETNATMTSLEAIGPSAQKPSNKLPFDSHRLPPAAQLMKAADSRPALFAAAAGTTDRSIHFAHRPNRSARL